MNHALMYSGSKYEVDARHAACVAADKHGLPQTVFYHADCGWTHTEPTAKVLRQRGTEVAVTYLPSKYFD
jgi:hypothetical protein